MTKKNYEILIAKKYFSLKKKSGSVSIITYFAIIGLTIGISALIITLSILSGFETEVTEKIIGFQSHIRLSTFHNEGFGDYENVLDKVSAIEVVSGVSPFIEREAMIRIRRNNIDEGIVLRGIDDKLVKNVLNIEERLVEGKMSLQAEDNLIQQRAEIIIGKDLKEKLGVNIGDTVFVVCHFGKRLSILRPGVEQFLISGIFETGLFEFDNSFVYANLETVQDL